MNISEKERMVMFDNGQRVTIQGAVKYTCDNTHLGITTDDGVFFVLNPERILYHRIVPTGPTTK